MVWGNIAEIHIEKMLEFKHWDKRREMQSADIVFHHCDPFGGNCENCEGSYPLSYEVGLFTDQSTDGWPVDTYYPFSPGLKGEGNTSGQSFDRW